VVNNAGYALGGGTAAAPDQDGLDGLLAVHVLAAVGTMSAAFADMRPRRWGRVVNTVSEAALDRRFVAGLGYGMAKAALWSATLVAAEEFSSSGVTVNAISPGARTRINAGVLDASSRYAGSAALDLDPRHVSEVVAYLVSDEAHDVTGRVVHAAAGEVREYSTSRTARSDLVERLRSAVRGSDG
jgi:NAD(P)-dependent dehydrogenase (short-subunit alcohol dehydrogenase family)